MPAIKKITVSLLLEGDIAEVGELVLSDSKIYFRYNADFLKNGLNLSPIKLPFTNDILSADKEPFDGLFGLFNDSLPDGWGRLLLDRSLASKGIDIARITPLDVSIRPATYAERKIFLIDRGYQPEIWNFLSSVGISWNYSELVGVFGKSLAIVGFFPTVWQKVGQV